MRFPSRICCGRSREEGASAAEYAGVIVAAVLLVIALILASPGWGRDLTCHIGSSLAKIFGSSWTCAPSDSSQADNPHKPKGPCKKSTHSQTASRSISVVVSVEENGGIVVEHMSDGTYRVTDKRGGKVGYSEGASAGGQITWDGHPVGAYAGASVGGNGTAEKGVTYVLNSKKEKDDLLGYLTRKGAIDATTGILSTPVNWVVDKVDNYEPPKPTELYVEFGAEGNASAEATLGLGGGKAAGKAAVAAGMRVNTKEGTTTIYYKVSASAIGQVGAAPVGQVGAEGSGEYMIAVTKSSDTNKTLNVSLSGTVDGQVNTSGPLGSGREDKNETGMTFNASVDLNSAETTSMANDLLRAAGIPSDSTASSSAEAVGNAADTFVNAAAERGVLTRQDISKDKSEYGVKGKLQLEVGVGFGISYTDETVTLSNGQYYDGHQWQTWEGCE